MEQHYVLAMYDVRGKQDFIYRSSKCKEIIGASQLIADVFREYLFPAAEEYCAEKWKGGVVPKGICTYIRDDMENQQPEAFAKERFVKNMETYIGEVVYEGGGNFFVLYRDRETCIGVNRIFTKRLLCEIGTLKVLCTYIEDVNFDDYPGDQKRLRKLHEKREAQENIASPANATPFTDVSPQDSMPYVDTHRKVAGKKEERVTREQKAKYVKYEEYIHSQTAANKYDGEEYLLDNLVTKKGEESLLAVIYIDGNSMGAKVEALFGRDDGQKSYDECVTKLRRFSADIDKTFVQDRRDAINKMLEEKHQKMIKKKLEAADGDAGLQESIQRKEADRKLRRTVIAAGDEMTIICNARDALDVVKAYFAGLNPDDGSACAGVAIFHSHSPYADAYRIAEECCENAKTVMKSAGVTNANLMDFHYCQGGVGISLESIRAQEGTADVISRPWRLDSLAGDTAISPVFCAEDLKAALSTESVKAVLSTGSVKDALSTGSVKAALSTGSVKAALSTGSVKATLSTESVKAASSTESEENVTFAGKDENHIPYFDAAGRMEREWHAHKQKLARTNIKALRDAAQAGTAETEQELARINAHRPKKDKIDFTLNGLISDADKRRRLIYDISIVYDLWFRSET